MLLWSLLFEIQHYPAPTLLSSADTNQDPASHVRNFPDVSMQLCGSQSSGFVQFSGAAARYSPGSLVLCRVQLGKVLV